ncbi:Holliday junction branch migration protein RuvA [Candidatus Falkowbacteria bacterium]|nr:Holliday junction branch migration protein RuvA [Candidatus Falkowbacteria bacterium]
MISYLKGKIQYVGANFIEINVNNIGYKIFTTANILNKAKVAQEVEIFCYQNVKEDAIDLFGFASREEQLMFEKLISVSGIGPKTALNALSVAKIDEIESAIISGDASVLTKISGIGKKTAERIVLELKNKYKGLAEVSGKIIQSEDADVIDALVGLGYSTEQARDVLRQIDKNIKGTEKKVKAALQLLSKKY